MLGNARSFTITADAYNAYGCRDVQAGRLAVIADTAYVDDCSVVVEGGRGAGDAGYGC